jgi:hypothetical protein
MELSIEPDQRFLYDILGIRRRSARSLQIPIQRFPQFLKEQPDAVGDAAFAVSGRSGSFLRRGPKQRGGESCRGPKGSQFLPVLTL